MSDATPKPVALLARNSARLEQPVSWINPPAWPLTALLPAGPALTLDHATARLLQPELPVSCSLSPLQAPEQPQTVLFIPKSRARLQMLAHLAAASTQAGGQLWLVGEKNQGIGSAGKALEPWTGAVKKLDAARHCALLEGVVGERPIFTLDSYWDEFEVMAGDRQLRLASLPGVFSHGRLDPGTQLLLDCLPADLPGRCLDFGSGCGVIAAVAALRGAAVTATDLDVAALAATSRTLAANGVAGQVVDELTRQSGNAERYDTLISNPPFHQGFRTTLATSRKFIADAPGMLRPGGRLFLVANRFLDYRSDLKRAFGSFETLADRRGFCVYRATAPAARGRLR